MRVGYYVHNVLLEEQGPIDRDNLSLEELIKNTKRTILNDKPRITKFRVKCWGDQSNSKMKEETNNNVNPTK